ncbi:MAG: hypothetical protein V3U26_03995 [Dehalococcoidia bacterium]
MTENGSREKPEEERQERRRTWPELSDLELVAWLLVGFVIGVALKVTTASAIIIALVVIAAIARLYLEGARTNPRPSIGMVPLFLLGWALGLFVRALVS